MDSEKVNLFIASKSEYFPTEAIPMIRERLSHTSADRELAIMGANYISPTLSIILSIFLGSLGVDRFLIGDIGMGFGKLLLTLACGIGTIWWIIDLFLIMGATKQKNLEKFLIAAG